MILIGSLFFYEKIDIKISLNKLLSGWIKFILMLRSKI